MPRWIIQKRAAGQIDKEVSAAWELIVQGVFRPNTGALEDVSVLVSAHLTISALVLHWGGLHVHGTAC